MPYERKGKHLRGDFIIQKVYLPPSQRGPHSLQTRWNSECMPLSLLMILKELIRSHIVHWGELRERIGLVAILMRAHAVSCVVLFYYTTYVSLRSFAIYSPAPLGLHLTTLLRLIVECLAHQSTILIVRAPVLIVACVNCINILASKGFLSLKSKNAPSSSHLEPNGSGRPSNPTRTRNSSWLAQDLHIANFAF